MSLQAPTCVIYILMAYFDDQLQHAFMCKLFLMVHNLFMSCFVIGFKVLKLHVTCWKFACWCTNKLIMWTCKNYIYFMWCLICKIIVTMLYKMIDIIFNNAICNGTFYKSLLIPWIKQCTLAFVWIMVYKSNNTNYVHGVPCEKQIDVF